METPSAWCYYYDNDGGDDNVTSASDSVRFQRKSLVQIKALSKRAENVRCDSSFNNIINSSINYYTCPPDVRNGMVID